MMETIKKDLTYSELFEGVYNFHEHDRCYVFPRLKDTLAIIEKIPGVKRIADIGSYLGMFSAMLAARGYEVKSFDMPHIDRTLYDKLGLELRTGYLEQGHLPFNDESFDMVVCLEVLEHLHFNPIPVLREMHRILRRGGTIMVITPNASSLNNRLLHLLGRYNQVVHYFIREAETSGYSCNESLHWHEYSASEARRLFAYIGFEKLQIQFSHAVIYPLSTEQRRWFKRVRGRLIQAISFLPSLRANMIVLAQRS